MAKIDDVARLAGVSTATVSRALRGLPTVSATTRSRVLAAAAQLGYMASPSASRLAGGRSGAVVVVVPRLTRWLFAAMVQAAETTLQRSGHALLLYTTHDARRPLHTSGIHKLVDAVMFVATSPDVDDVVAVTDSGLPGVIVGSGVSMPGWPTIGIDDAAAVRTATEHLLAVGHRRIGYLADVAATHPDRRRGFLEALAGAGMTGDPELIVEGADTLDGGADATAELLRRRRPTGLVAECDEMAMGAIVALRRADLRVPADVSVIGIDDHALAPAVGLSTVAQPAVEQGRRAAAALLAPLRGEHLVAEANVILPTHLVVRASTGPCQGTIEPPHR